jgi:hypothetical protein
LRADEFTSVSFLGDDLKFNAFVGKDFFKNLKHDPKRAILGVDPLSTKLWNKILNRDDKPLVDQLGGPYGGHTISAFGKQNGGVYQRARDEGIDTGASEKMQDLAHVVAAVYGAGGIAGAGGGTPAAGGEGATGWGGAGTGGFEGALSFGPGMSVGGGNAGQLASAGGIQGGAGIGSATEGGAASAFNWQDLAKQGMKSQQQQTPKNKWLEEELARQDKERELKRQIAEQLGTRYV